jgi:pullulanase
MVTKSGSCKALTPQTPTCCRWGRVVRFKKGNLNEQRAYWVSEDTILWPAADDSTADYRLHYAANGGLALTDEGVSKFPHLADLPALKIAADDLAMVPDILKGQIAVSAVDAGGAAQDATGLQIPGVLDDLYTYDGAAGRHLGRRNVPTIRLWAPTAKSVTFHLFADADPATTSATTPMAWDPATGVWSITGQPAGSGSTTCSRSRCMSTAPGRSSTTWSPIPIPSAWP